MRSKVSPASVGMVIFMLCTCIAMWMVMKNYLPMREQLKLYETCTSTIDAKVITTKQKKEGIYYYGPKVEYYCTINGQTIRADVVSTVNYGKGRFKKDEFIGVAYNPGDFSLVMLREDDTAIDRFRRSELIAGTLFGLGAAVLIMTVVNQFMRTRPKKYDTAPDGSSFEEWQKKQADSKDEDKQEEETDGSEKA